MENKDSPNDFLDQKEEKSTNGNTQAGEALTALIIHLIVGGIGLVISFCLLKGCLHFLYSIQP